MYSRRAKVDPACVAACPVPSSWFHSSTVRKPHPPLYLLARARNRLSFRADNFNLWSRRPTKLFTVLSGKVLSRGCADRDLFQCSSGESFANPEIHFTNTHWTTCRAHQHGDSHDSGPTAVAAASSPSSSSFRREQKQKFSEIMLQHFYFPTRACRDYRYVYYIPFYIIPSLYKYLNYLLINCGNFDA